MVAFAKEEIGRDGDADQVAVSRGISRPWSVHNATSEAEAISTVAASAPSLVDGLLLTSIHVRETIENTYKCEAGYGLIAPRPEMVAGESQFNFEIATAPQRIIIPIAPQTVYSATGESAPADSNKWLIGQQADGSAPEGAEVAEPNASFSETHIVDASTVTSAYQKTVLKIVGKLNNTAFRGWDAKEVLCTGVSGSRRGYDDWEISYRFSVREHQTGLTIAGISGIDKQGWQHIWPRYSLEKDSTAPIISNVVKHIVVADVFRTAAFSDLGIGA